ncbi:hypothetical protein EDD85DRAFT_797653 [Armillaria nabsnona]|nr:hypothetical protein EDD85DRAFT_797653 [Armillaria nabsnona]
MCESKRKTKTPTGTYISASRCDGIMGHRRVQLLLAVSLNRTHKTTGQARAQTSGKKTRLQWITSSSSRLWREGILFLRSPLQVPATPTRTGRYYLHATPGLLDFPVVFPPNPFTMLSAYVSIILEAIKAGPQIEKIQPLKTQLSVYFYDQKCATRCLDANRGSALSLKFTYAKGRLPSTIVASLGRYHASRILSIDHVPQKFDVQTPQELAPNGVESFHYNESDAQLEIHFFDTSKAFKAGQIHSSGTLELQKVTVRLRSRRRNFPDWYQTEEIDSRGPLKRSIEIRCITSSTTAEACLAWTNRFDEVSPASVYASFVPKREIIYLGFATELGAGQLMKMFQFNAGKIDVEMELLAGDHTVHSSLIMALSLCASHSLAFTLNQEQYNVLRRKDCRKLFSRKGRVFFKIFCSV